MTYTALETHNAALAIALLQSQQQNQATLGPALVAPQIEGGQESTTWAVGSNKPEYSRACPESTLAIRPTSFKEALGIEKAATLEIYEYFRLGNDEKTSKITLTVWVNSLIGYLEERGLDNVLRIFDPVRNTKVYLLKDWGLHKPYRFVAWDNIVLTGIGGAPVRDHDGDNLKWSGKAITNRILLYLWE